MTLITTDQLANIMPYAGSKRIEKFTIPLNSAMQEFKINTPNRIAAFLAQIAHESGSLVYTKEIASGAAYDTRTDLGNTPQLDGDGQKYKGRGLIQITGTTNYRACGKALQLDLMNHPELLEAPIPAARSAAWFWNKHGCNELADAGKFHQITKVINGGTNGYKERNAFYAVAKGVLGVGGVLA